MSKPKVIACIIFFYGEEYLDACIRSIDPYCDKIVILWTNHPTQGYNHHLPSPDAGKDIKSIAMAASNKIQFVDVSNEHIAHEGDHRNLIYKYTDGYDIMMYVDPDEVFEPLDMEHTLDQISKSPYREHGVSGYYHFWRSFDYMLNDDGFRPIRFINLHVPFVSTDPKGCVEQRVYHFSLCQREETIRHKFQVFGHASEIRQNYVDDVWKSWYPETDHKWLHPTSMGIWQKAFLFDKTTLPEVLKNHPNYNKTYKETW